GRPGTALFSLAEGKTESAVGVVRYDGRYVEIDVTGVAGHPLGLLVFQLTSGDSDTGTTVDIHSVTSTVDADGVPAPVFAAATGVVAGPGAAPDTAAITPTTAVGMLVGNVRLDPATGRYTAELRLRNQGAAVGRRVVAVLPGLPAGVQLLNPSGTTESGV